MVDPIKGEWIRVAAFLLGIGLAYAYHDQGLAVTQAALMGIFLGEQLLRMRLRIRAENGAPRARSPFNSPPIWRQRPLNDLTRDGLTMVLFLCIMGFTASRTGLFGDSVRWWNWAVIVLFLALGAFSLFLLSRDFWKLNKLSGDSPV